VLLGVDYFVREVDLRTEVAVKNVRNEQMKENDERLQRAARKYNYYVAACSCALLISDNDFQMNRGMVSCAGSPHWSTTSNTTNLLRSIMKALVIGYSKRVFMHNGNHHVRHYYGFMEFRDVAKLSLRMLFLSPDRTLVASNGSHSRTDPL
jgi:hypothetical protein